VPRLTTYCPPLATLMVALAGLAASYVAAADGVVARSINVARDGIISFRTGDVAVGDLVNELDAALFSSRWMLLHIPLSKGGMNLTTRDALAALGLNVVGYFPTDFYIAECTNLATGPANARSLNFVDAAYAYKDEWKLDNTLYSLPPAEQVSANVWLFNTANDRAVRAAISLLPGTTLLETELVGTTVRLAIVAARVDLDFITSLTDVQYIEPQPRYTLRSNVTTRWTIQSGVLNITPLYARGINGAGQIIGVIDGGLGVNHCSFSDTLNPIGANHRKIAAYNTTISYDSHGTHVSGTAAGEAIGGDFSSNQRGVAYNARIVFNTYPSATQTSVFTRHFTHFSQGAFTQTNSWGTDSTRAYDGGTRAIDTLLFQNDGILISHAASNGSLVTNPENAKNSLCVTASQNGAGVNNICVGGSGPTEDGRRKPEVAAPGCAITSATGSSGCNTTTITGTSMATPAVGGLGVLVRQYYLNGFYPSGVASAAAGFAPSGALVKATIINSARDMTGVPGYPSDREGFGHVVADNTLFFAGDPHDLLVRDIRNNLRGALDTAGVYVMRFDVTAASNPLRVTLCYHDAPAEVNASVAAVNNLNLVVKDPLGNEYKGNVFVDGVSGLGGLADAINNTEQVLILGAIAGEWEVTVSAASVPAGPQGFALVISGRVQTTAPCPGDFNSSGGVDGDDVEDFFTAWAMSDSAADSNQDGGVDGADVESFFGFWQGGC